MQKQLESRNMTIPLALWFFFSVIVGFALVHLGNLPLWLTALVATVIAYTLQYLCLRLIVPRRRMNQKVPSHAGVQTECLPEGFIQNQDFDLNNRPVCPECGAKDVAKIIYGKPALTRQIMEGLEAGTIISGGCLVHINAPDWHCHNCNQEFGQLHPKPDTNRVDADS